MNVGQLIQTLFATVVGGLIVIATNWISAKGKSREAIQEWYEQTYIIEGIDPLVAYYQYLVFSLFDQSNGNKTKVAQRDVPVEALSKVRVLLNNFVPLNIIIFTHSLLTYTTDTRRLGDAARILQNAVEALLDFRLELTTEVPSHVHSKHYIADTTYLINRLNKVEKELDDLNEQQIVEENIVLEPTIENIRKPQKAIKRRSVPHLKSRKAPYPTA